MRGGGTDVRQSAQQDAVPIKSRMVKVKKEAKHSVVTLWLLWMVNNSNMNNNNNHHRHHHHHHVQNSILLDYSSLGFFD